MSRRGRHGRRIDAPRASIDMNSLIDLTFLLLVTFMLTIPALEQGISIMLPRAKTDILPNKNAKANTITVDVENKIYLNDVPTTLDQLEVDLRAMVEEHTFREDLFYRINLINLHLPPLRERRDDIPLLVEHFLSEACASNGIMSTTVSAEAIAYLQTLPFTGNIRELKNLVERALLMKNPEKNILNVEDFLTLAASSMNKGGEKESLTSDFNAGMDGVSLSCLERNAIAACIAKHNGNLSLVAKELGISRGALYRKIEKHGL